jgi:uncharacterized protein YjbJ (UPF0337 family)
MLGQGLGPPKRAPLESGMLSGSTRSTSEDHTVTRPGWAGVREESCQSRSFRVLKLNRWQAVERRAERAERRAVGRTRTQGAMDKLEGRAKEAAGAVTGNEATKSEGRSDRRKGTAKEKKGKLKDLFK